MLAMKGILVVSLSIVRRMEYRCRKVEHVCLCWLRIDTVHFNNPHRAVLKPHVHASKSRHIDLLRLAAASTARLLIALTIRIIYVFPGCTATVTFCESLIKADFGTGSAPVGFVTLRNDWRSFLIGSWYQSENESTISSSYLSLKGPSKSCTTSGARRPSGYCPRVWEWNQYVPGWSTYNHR